MLTGTTNRSSNGNVIIKLVIFIIVFAVISYFACRGLINYSLENIPSGLGRLVVSLAADNKINIARFYVGEPRLRSWRTLKFTDLSVSGNMVKSESGAGEKAFELKVSRIILRLDSFRSKAFSLRLHGISLHIKGNENNGSSELAKKSINDKILEGDFYMPFRLNFFNRRHAIEQLSDIAQKLRDLINTGETSLPFEFLGRSSFSLNGNLFDVELTTMWSKGRSRFVANTYDIERVCDKLGLKINASEMDIIANNPVRAPGLLQIREYVMNKARSVNLKNPEISGDAYRHVLWSYLLTKAYGEKFSRVVTNAHETGSVIQNTEAQRLQDVLNNEVGIRYASEGRKEPEILGLMKTDPSVVNTPAGQTKEVVKN